MLNRNKILKKIKEPEDRLFIAHILDKAEKALRECGPVPADFMDPGKKRIAEKCLEGNIDIEYLFYGGYAGAEREIIIFAPDFVYNFNGSGFEAADISCLSYIKVLNIYNKSMNKLTRRDYAGALS